MINIKKNFGAIMLCILVILLIIHLITENLVDSSLDSYDGESNKKGTLLSRNFIDLNQPVYSNKAYKKNIACDYVPKPLSNKFGVRVNYFNSKKKGSLLVK